MRYILINVIVKLFFMIICVCTVFVTKKGFEIDYEFCSNFVSFVFVKAFGIFGILLKP